MNNEKRVTIDVSPTYPRGHENDWIGDDVLGQYIHDTKKHPRLPADEVARLSRLVQAGIGASSELSTLGSDVNSELRKELEVRVALGNNARNEIIVANTGLVFHYANHHTIKSVDYLDLIQAGNLGLIRAVEKFDPDKGHAFSTYAKWWIKAFMSQEIYWTSRAIRIPEYTAAQMNKLRKLIEQYAATTGEEMSLEQMAHAMNKDQAEILDLLSLEKEMISLDKPIDDEGDTVLENFLHDSDAIAIDEIATDTILEESIVREVQSLLEVSTLDERSKQIVRMQFGIGYDRPMAITEIIKNVTGRRETIIMLSRAALEHLRSEAELFQMDRLLDAESE